jgi:replicative DNA helicase
MNDILMPHNETAEAKLLASILVDASNFSECSELRASDFYSTINRKLFENLSERIRNRLPTDPDLIHKDDLEIQKYITKILDDPGPAGNVTATCKLLRGESVKRTLVEQANAILKRAMSTDMAQDTVDYACRQIASLSAYGSQDSGVSLRHVFTAERMVEEYKSHLANLQNNRFITGIHEIDKRIRGVAGGEVLTILARAGSFKTALLQNLINRYVLYSSWGAVMFSLEMPVAPLTERWFQILDGVTGKEVEKQFSDATQSASAAASISQFCRDMARVLVVDAKVGLDSIPQYVKLIEQEHKTKTGLIGIDYLGLMDCQGKDEYQQISHLARGVKDVAKRLNVPIVLLCQVSRKGGDGEIEVSLDMGRGSGAIEEAGDFVLGLWQQECNTCDEEGNKHYDLICRILKNRKGSKGSRWILEIEPSKMTFGHGAVRWVAPKPVKRKKCVG